MRSIPEPGGVGDALAYLTAVSRHDFQGIKERLDPEWVEAALQASDAVTIRRRRIPAEEAVWLVLGAALMRDKPLVEIVDRLGLALPARSGAVVASSAVSQARARLGAEPMQWLFTRSGDEWAHASAAKDRWHGLAVYGIDGSTMRVPDSVENRKFFGGQPGRKESDSGYPLVRIAVLMAVRSHLLAGASFGPYGAERAYAAELWSLVPDNSVVLVDRGLFGAVDLVGLTTKARNRHWVSRATKANKWAVVEKLGKGDEIVDMKVSAHAKAKDPTLPATWRMRAIRYQRRGFEPQIILTSLLDPDRFPRDQIEDLYHERWELELGYDELKTELLAREEAIRSKSPELVRQEIWGLLLAYNLVRLEMVRIADEAGVPPRRISFVAALRAVCDQFDWAAITQAAERIPKRLAAMRAKLKRFVLPERRLRSAPRAVKTKMSNYPRKRPSTDRSLK